MSTSRFLMTSAALLLVSPSVLADYDDGLAAARRGDYATALEEWRPLAESGDSDAQYNLGRVPQDYAEALSWYRKAAAQGQLVGNQ